MEMSFSLLEHSNISDVIFKHSNISDVIFKHSNISDVIFKHSNISDVIENVVYFSLEIEFNVVLLTNYKIAKLCATFAAQSITNFSVRVIGSLGPGFQYAVKITEIRRVIQISGEKIQTVR